MFHHEAPVLSSRDVPSESVDMKIDRLETWTCDMQTGW